jgi:PilZ domain-containing protein
MDPLFHDNIRRLRRPENTLAAPGRRWKTNWPAELSLASGRLPCVVVDISSWGAQLRLATQPAEHERVWLTLENIGTVPATVVWQREGCVGVQFQEQQAWIRRLHAQPLDPVTRSPAANESPASP